MTTPATQMNSSNIRHFSAGFIDEMKKVLLDKKQELQEDLAGMSAHTELGDTEEDNAEEIPVDEANQDVIKMMKSDLQKINNALKKIQEGTYGTDAAGAEISEARLKAMPWADKAL